jgi:serine/threonine protein kinase
MTASQRLVFDEALAQRMPLPLAQLYRRGHNAKPPLERHLTAFYLWEAALKLLSSVAVVEYARLGPPAPEIAERLQNLARPALGHWWEFVRLLVPLLVEGGREAFQPVRELLLGRARDDLPRAAGLDAALHQELDGVSGARAVVRLSELLDRLVRYRNTFLGHGAPARLTADFHERLGGALLAGAAEVLGRLDVLAGRRLIHVGEVRQTAGVWLVRRYELIGANGRPIASLELPRTEAAQLPDGDRLYLAGAADDLAELVPLHPLLVYDAEAEEVLFLNARRGRRRMEYLCYTSGRTTDLESDHLALLGQVLGTDVQPGGDDREPTGGEDETPARRVLGEFELLSELGRGGMGVVYRAWQPSLGRQVALKKPLSVGDERAEARFRREIRALGRVDHPNLVKVFTSGADGDQWFYAMELIDGVPLSAVYQRLQGRPGGATSVDQQIWQETLASTYSESRRAEKQLVAPAEAPAPTAAAGAPPVPRSLLGGNFVRHVVELMRQAAQAAHALHEAGVIHRDIKPDNIVVTADGAQAILMDLGLARLADEEEGRVTRTRQFVGTLRYASPQQVLAAGRLDRRTDVYSLGATLWELLALRPLYGATEETPTPELMERVQRQEPERLRSVNRTVGRDLEAIAHKCLEKDPARRYGTAAELVADLERWQRHEPVRARRVRGLERAVQWMWRRPAAAALLAVSVLAALTLLVGGIWFTWHLDQERRRADNNAREAQDNATKARESEADAKAALAQAEEALAVGMLRPIGVTEHADINDVELSSLWDLARLPKEQERVRVLFIDKALAKGETSLQLERRLSMALVAACGLDPQRSQRVRDVLLRRLGDPDADLRVHRVSFYAGVELGLNEDEFVRAVAPHIVPIIINSRNSVFEDPWRRLSNTFHDQGIRQGSDRTAAAFAPVAARITDALAIPRQPWEMHALSETLASLAPLLDPEICRTSAESILRILAVPREKAEVDCLYATLAALVTKLDPITAGSTIRAAVDTLEKAGRWRDLALMMYGAAPGTIQPINLRTRRPGKTLAERLGPDQARTALAAILRGFDWPGPGSSLAELADAYLALVGKVDSPEAPDRVVNKLAAAIVKGGSFQLPQLASLLAEATRRLSPDEASAACAPAVARIIKDLASSQDALHSREFTEAVAVLAPRLNSADAADAAAGASRGITSAPIQPGREGLCRCVAFLTARLKPDQARAICTPLVTAMHLNLTEATQPFAVACLARGCAALAERLPADQAHATCTAAAARLAEVLPRAESDFDSNNLFEALAELEKQSSVQVRRDAVSAVCRAMAQAQDRYGDLGRLAKLFAALTEPLRDEEVREAYETTAKLLTDALERGRENTYAVSALLDALSVVARRLSTGTARTAAAQINRTLADPKSQYSLPTLGRTLAALASGLGPDEARALCEPVASRLVEAFKKIRDFDYNAAGALSAALADLARHLEPPAARSAAAAVSAHALTEKSDMPAARELCNALAQLTKRLDADEAAAVCAPAAARVVEALCRTRHEGDLKTLHRALETLAERLDERRAVELLKHPTCVGPARDVLLRRLGQLHSRGFATIEDLIVYLERHEPSVDLAAPPQRP